MTVQRVYESAPMFEKGRGQAPRSILNPAVSSRWPSIPNLPTEAGAKRSPSSSWLTFARDTYYWSPARIFRTLHGVLSNIPRQIEIFRLMRIPVYAGFVRADARFRFKFLIRDYLVRGFSTGQRAACFLHHYRRLRESLSEDSLAQILYRKITLFEADRMDVRVEISLSFSRPFEKEGELSLILHVDGMDVFVLSFTIAPGWVVASEASEVVLISRLQGTNGYYEQIRAATRALHNVGPAALLLAALHGFAKALGMDRMAGVSAVQQSSFTDSLAPFYRSAYDDFFSEIDVPRNASGFFHGPIPPEERPMSSIKQGHKIRTKEKRQFKRALAEEVCLLLRQRMSVRDPQPAHEEEGIRMVNPLGAS